MSDTQGRKRPITVSPISPKSAPLATANLKLATVLAGRLRRLPSRLCRGQLAAASVGWMRAAQQWPGGGARRKLRVPTGIMMARLEPRDPGAAVTPSRQAELRQAAAGCAGHLPLAREPAPVG